MSALVDYGDPSEWSLFGDQMLITADLEGDIPFDTDSCLHQNSLESDSGNMTDWFSDSDIAYMSGVTTTLKVLSCPADDEQYVINELDNNEDDKWSNVVESDLFSESGESSYQPNSNIGIACLLMNNNLDSKCGLPDATLSPCFVFDGISGPDTSVVAVYASDEVSVEEEYVEVELKSEPECDDAEFIIADNNELLNLVGFDSCHSVCFSDDDSSLSGSSSHDTDNFGGTLDYCWNENELQGSMLHESDKRLRKKEQNKSAAMRYRLKKRVERGSMQSELDCLRRRNVELKTKLEQMTRELGYLKELVDELDM